MIGLGVARVGLENRLIQLPGPLQSTRLMMPMGELDGIRDFS